ncbi:ribbon-helix-helix domain-containing protein [Streptacidiphilus fuscans]|uniref:Ribbon-helix-helix domain-containing protein n=1 Tax=Streptacidiphilus fuscans TaxID=2789292 RepID=A0A931B516_9ACTN|nr:ribbon-helix-helix domain-containing protein [Streptacidiphilus fuscans]MBF9070408.1 ribbon-helix-helix domain-containing protein [Streptacidiphilus fuscans]
MASKKVTITLEEALVEAMNVLAREAGVPVSRLIASAAERELRLRVGRAEFVAWQAEHGALTPQELADARAEMATADAEYLSGGGSEAGAA